MTLTNGYFMFLYVFNVSDWLQNPLTEIHINEFVHRKGMSGRAWEDASWRASLPGARRRWTASAASPPSGTSSLSLPRRVTQSLISSTRHKSSNFVPKKIGCVHIFTIVTHMFLIIAFTVPKFILSLLY